MQFGTHFEIYEQHCALEKINLTSLNRAMLNQDFMAYLKVCECINYIAACLCHTIHACSCWKISSTTIFTVDGIYEHIIILKYM